MKCLHDHEMIPGLRHFGIDVNYQCLQ